mmetsp:Transcript_121432/g.288538  ORF Transcript_121432/g.288538 Transcript_121432/m.288538 type:complete len:190 (+) Transcript_121432:106-675(+)
MATCSAWLECWKRQSRIQIIGLAMFCWSVICLTSVVVFPDKSSLPGLLLVMLFGSLILATVSKILVSDTCKSIKHRSSEHVQDHIWAPMAFESLGAANPSFHRIQIRSTETSKGTKSTISILEEVDALCPTYCKQQTCVCCLDDFKCQDKVSLLPCGHVLHESCLVDWHVLKKCGHAACPICRDSWASV